jgi:hypothetical protein
MKNSILKLALFVAVLVGMLYVTACGKLDKPSDLHADFWHLSWDAVDGAEEYAVEIKGEEYRTKETFFELFQYVAPGETVKIKVKHIGEVDIDDAVLLLQYSIFPEDYPIEYTGSVDFDKSGEIDIDDAVLLLQYSIFPEDYPIG